VTLHEVLERAAEMNLADRRKLVRLCGDHDMGTLPRTTTGGHPGPPIYCPICFTVFSPASFRPWNPTSLGGEDHRPTGHPAICGGATGAARTKGRLHHDLLV